MAELHMDLDEYQRLFDQAVERCLAEAGVDEARLDRTLAAVGDTVPQLVEDIADELFGSLTARSREVVESHQAERRGFEDRLEVEWGPALESLRAFLILSVELGSFFNSRHRPEASATRDYTFEALIRLHARAVQIGHEVLCLLEGGFADGAHARWRTAHELAVVALFLSGRDKRVAEGYLEHEAVESRRAMLQYAEHAEALGQAQPTEQERAAVESAYRETISKYGPAYGGEYGWAAAELGKKRPTFTDIERSVGLEHLRPYFRMASHNVHGGPKGIHFRLGVKPGFQGLLAGPSNIGLTDPAQGAALSVLHVSSAMLLGSRVNLDGMIYVCVLTRYVERIAESFWAIESAILKREADSEE